MNKKIYILTPLIVVILTFSLISCSIPTQATIDSSSDNEIAELKEQLKDKDKEIQDLEDELKQTKKDLESVQKTLDRKLAEEVEEEPEPEIQPQENYRIGDEIIFYDARTMKEICSVIINSIENYKHTGYLSPDDGMRFVAFDVEVRNLSNEVQGYNALNYSLRDADYYRYDRLAYAKEPIFSSGDLAPNDIMRGWVTIEVPEDITIVEILVGPCYSDPPAIIKLVPALDPSI